jgi:hypothetical protein
MITLNINKQKENSMKKITSTLSLFAFLLTLSCGIFFCQEVDLSGTWEGKTEVPDTPEPDQLTLVIEKIDGEYRGTINDSLGFAEDAELEDVEFKDNTFTFSFTIFDGFEYDTVYATLKVEGNRMSGSWESEGGTSGSVELVKKDQ